MPEEPFVRATAFSRAGVRVELANPQGGDWKRNAGTLHALQRIDTQIASQVLIKSEDKLLQALQTPQSHDMQELAKFILIADDIDEMSFDHMLSRLDAVACEPV